MIDKYGYKVRLDTTGQYWDDGEEWGEWTHDCTNTLSPIAEKTADYPDLVSDFDYKKGSSALVVWVEWSHGDSFGSGTNNGSEVLYITDDIKIANEFVEKIEDSINFTLSNGEIFKLPYCPWEGYFEHDPIFNINVVTIV